MKFAFKWNSALRLFELTRQSTIGLGESFTPPESQWTPRPGKWSAGEILHHLVLADALFGGILNELFSKARRGDRSTLRHSFRDVNNFVGFLPPFLQPFADLPFTALNLITPAPIREAIARSSWLPLKNPDAATPAKGLTVGTLLNHLRSSAATIQAGVLDATGLDPGGMRYQHPLLGPNDAVHMLRLLCFHERRHQEQLRSLRRSLDRMPRSSTHSHEC